MKLEIPRNQYLEYLIPKLTFSIRALPVNFTFCEIYFESFVANDTVFFLQTEKYFC